MDDDFTQDYLRHRMDAERENSGLANFLRQNADKFVDTPQQPTEPLQPQQGSPAPPSSGGAGETDQKPSTFRKVLDYTAFMLRPLGALQEAAIAPMAKGSTSVTDAFKTSGKAFLDALVPTPPGAGEGRPDYEKQVLDRFPGIPDRLRPAAEVFLGLTTDPAILAFPFMKSIRAGLEVRAMDKTTSGPWRRALEEAVSIAPTQVEDTPRLKKLADAADAGDQQAARELVGVVTEEDLAATQLARTMGDPSEPLVRLEASVGKFTDAPTTATPARAVNINLSRVNTSEDVQAIIDQTARAYAGSIDDARRGVQSNEATAALAETMGMTPEQLITRRRGQAFNAEEALAARQILISSAESLQELAVKALTPNAGDLDKIAFRKQLALHKGIQEQVSGLTAEAGRALQQFNMMAGSTKEQLARIKDLTESMITEGDLTDDMARAIISLKTPEQIADFSRNITRATSKDVFFEVWINSLLSGPQTHVVNTVSNSLVALWQIPERFLAAGISKVSGGGGVQATEALGQMYGMVEGFKDGLKAAARTAVTEVPADVVGKVEAPMRAAISGDALGISGSLGRAVDYLGRGVRLPGTLLSAEDAFFKSIGYRMELHARAFRQVAEEGLTGSNAAKRVQQILSDPPADIKLAAVDAARYQTFTKPLGETGRAYQRMVASQPVLKVLTPFVRTPTNIFKFFGERSPFAPLAKSFQADVKAGGARRDLALARMAMGSTVMGVAATYASEGRITGGGPVDNDLRSLAYNTGWQPYSIKFGDQYISYGRLEPLGTLIGVAADFAEIAGELNETDAAELAAHLSMAVAKNVTSKTFLRGLTEAVNALDDPVRYGEQWWMNFVQTAIPTGVAQVARVQDPVLRETRTVMDRFRSRIPGYSKDLPPRRNIWGEPIVLSGGLGPDIISPFYTSTKKDDPVSEELLDQRVPITMPERSVRGVELSPEQYDRLIILTGKEPLSPGAPTMKDALREVIGSEEYRRLSDGPDGGKAYMIQKITSGYKAAARAKLLQEDDELRRLIEKTQQDRFLGGQ